MSTQEALYLGLLVSFSSMLGSFIYSTLRRRTALDSWEYGWCRNNHARRDRNTREVQFLLWKPGEQGWAKGMWVDFGPGQEGDFFAWEGGSVMRPEMVTRKMQEEYFKGQTPQPPRGF